VAVAVIGVLFTALYSVITFGFLTMQMAQENQRASQIMLEKTETIRLYTWNQVNTPGFIPTNFTASFDPQGSTNARGLVFTGNVAISAAPINASYSNDMKKITVTLNWVSGKVPRQREFFTYISRDGMQNYIY
jgi:L-cystine uptake protein TcyP (sodium:dicarboxylate symporter family)